ncbi:MAG: gamma-glutamylcyclotransferase [Chitinophagales bacterium]
MSSRNYLFVYGTLRLKDSLLNSPELKAGTSFEGKAKIRAVLFDIGHYPGAIQDKSGSEVIGSLYEVNQPEKMFRILDRYENIVEGQEANGEYIRLKTRAWLPSGKSRMAWVYLYNRDPGSKPRIRHKDYLNYLIWRRKKLEKLGSMVEKPFASSKD